MADFIKDCDLVSAENSNWTPENGSNTPPPTGRVPATICDRVYGEGATTAKLIDGVACCPSCEQPLKAHGRSAEGEIPTPNLVNVGEKKDTTPHTNNPASPDGEVQISANKNLAGTNQGEGLSGNYTRTAMAAYQRDIAEGRVCKTHGMYGDCPGHGTPAAQNDSQLWPDDPQVKQTNRCFACRRVYHNADIAAHTAEFHAAKPNDSQELEVAISRVCDVGYTAGLRVAQTSDDPTVWGQNQRDAVAAAVADILALSAARDEEHRARLSRTVENLYFKTSSVGWIKEPVVAAARDEQYAIKHKDTLNGIEAGYCGAIVDVRAALAAEFGPRPGGEVKVGK